ncbi:MAG: peptide MFS transporter [Dysgonamonadaceae bacterium]|jgi:POT family proton-dependent oligopeptide transporter|nr:peptide MFS transporter [Dysgonamonadaceae bacterium]MDD4378815.1 peptide MFS transporter [Dysgonamonadaceae bacterium]NLH28802.1 peptide MFS transporter [Bacteroidales bacterium]
MFKDHPKGLLVLALTNMGERFGYYTMLAILTLYMQAKFGLTSASTSMIYGSFLALVYFLPLFGGVLADKVLGYGKTVLLGIFVMFVGYLLLAVPMESNTIGLAMMFCSLILIALGTGFFKGNLQALLGKLYDNPKYSKNRDIAFSIFYMFINIGAFFAPSAANYINNAVLRSSNFTYDASIPKNYVILNDEAQAIDKNTFIAQHLTPEEQQLTEKEFEAVLNKAKKEHKVVFMEEIEESLFRLKAAGLHQYTQAGKIADPAMMVTTREYEILQSRDPADAEEKAAIIAKIQSIHITDPELGGGPHPDDFARNFGKRYVNESLSISYNLAFGVACISLVFSVLIFLLFKGTWKAEDKTVKQKIEESKANGKEIKIMPKEEVKERMVALLLVFFVVIFFWMSFHQNGLTLTFFARDYTQSTLPVTWTLLFSLFPLLSLIVFLYGIYLSTVGLLGSKPNKKVGLLLTVAGIAGVAGYYFANIKGVDTPIKITPQIFQQFNPMFIIILTPLTVALFSYLANKGKEPSAPRKIGIGMFLAAVGFAIMLIGSIGLPAPSEISGVSDKLVSPGWLINTYFALTVAELFLSPMGLSFVSKVAPPQYSGLMQGGWLAATAIGNLLVGVIGTFWEKLPLVGFWSILIICCVLSGIFIFSVMKRLEKATGDL